MKSIHHNDDEHSEEKIWTTRNVNQQEPNNHNQGNSMHNHLNFVKALKASNRSVTNYINLLKERIQELLRTELEISGSKLAWVNYL